MTAAGGGGGTYRINKLQTELKELQCQLQQSEDLRLAAEDALHKVKDGNVCLMKLLFVVKFSPKLLSCRIYYD